MRKFRMGLYSYWMNSERESDAQKRSKYYEKIEILRNLCDEGKIRFGIYRGATMSGGRAVVYVYALIVLENDDDEAVKKLKELGAFELKPEWRFLWSALPTEEEIDGCPEDFDDDDDP